MILSKIVLVTGGSRSGKSKFAEELLHGKDDVLYIATAKITDSEMENRIQKHKERRNKSWKTYEGYENLDKVIENFKGKYIMLDCITFMITNFMFQDNKDFDNISNDEINKMFLDISCEVKKFILKAKDTCKGLVMVTSEVGCSVVPEYKVSRIFKDFTGSINQLIASLSHEVYLVSCGLPLRLK